MLPAGQAIQQLPRRTVSLIKVYADGTQSPALRVTAISTFEGLAQWLGSPTLFNSSDRTEEVQLRDLWPAIEAYIMQNTTMYFETFLKLAACVAADTCTVKVHVNNSSVAQQMPAAAQAQQTPAAAQAPRSGNNSSAADNDSGGEGEEGVQKRERNHFAWHKEAVVSIDQHLFRDPEDGLVLQMSSKGENASRDDCPCRCAGSENAWQRIVSTACLWGKLQAQR